ncbi:MAG: PEP-utilizing enzyme [Candidatus Micrarchaeota archaeon]|nr:PEP-utilizing enzyme [Candidatus Micrarchaeota archaeon]
MKEWVRIWSRTGSVQMAVSFCLSTAGESARVWGLNLDEAVHFDGNTYSGYCLEGEKAAAERAVMEKVRDPVFRKTFFKKAYAVLGDLLRFCRKLDRKRLEKASGPQLAGLYSAFWDKRVRATAHFWFGFFAAEPLGDAVLEELGKIRGKATKPVGHYSEAIFSPPRPTYPVRERMELLKLAAAFRENASGEKFEEAVLRHARKWAWLPMYDTADEVYGAGEVAGKAREILAAGDPKKELSRLRDEQGKRPAEYRKALRELEPAAGQKQLFEFAHEAAFYKEYRNEVRARMSLLSRGLYGEIARRAGLALDEALLLTPREITGFLAKGKLDLDALRERKKGCVLVQHGDRITIHTGREAEGIAKKLVFVEKTGVLKGTPASPGKARGVARIIHGPGDLVRLRQGDVLVASMTKPAYMVAMEKASAIVTDEGGLLCHAAIVGRELKKPCIVGTKNATQTLKEGELIEVDADSGTVKRVKR